MARVKVVIRKKPRQKVKPEKKNIVGPRLRLEPRLNASDILQISNSTELTENNNNEQSVNINNGMKNLFQFTTKNENSINDVKIENQNLSNGTATAKKLEQDGVGNRVTSFITDTIEISGPQTSNTTHSKGLSKSRTKKRKSISGSINWNDDEYMRLISAFQTLGMGDLDKVADVMKTKNLAQVRDYIKLRSKIMGSQEKATRLSQAPNSWRIPEMDLMPFWPNIRKWRKMACNQMLNVSRRKDYSQPVLSSLCKRFYEEAEEFSDSQIIDVKSIYKFMLDCVSGDVPAQLLPKESALVLELIKETKLMSLQYDFEEERQFLHNYKAATRFKEKHIKDEFKKKILKNMEDSDPEAIGVPEEIFMDLSRHKRLVQSFNPLMAPLWMLQNEHVSFEKYMKELNCDK